ncbi:MAG: hypothetical protein IKW98_13665 [Prevotella sp.]|nr:hypothetical protein [Prevotella sp.]
MMEKNNKFHWCRFWTLLKNHFEDGWKTIMWVALAVLLLSTASLLYFSLFGITTTDNPLLKGFNGDMMSALMAISNTSIVVSIFIYVILSLVCSNMSNRSGEISYLMFPATNLEKWLSRVIYVFVVGCLMVDAVFYLSLFLCEGIGHLFDIAPLQLLTDVQFNNSLMENITNVKVNCWVWIVDFCGSFLFVTLFILGGTYFRRMGWLYTALIILVVGVILTVGGIIVSTFLFNDTMAEFFRTVRESSDLSVVFTLLDGVFKWMSGISVALGMLALWLSYKLFCRRQIEAHRIKIIK